MATLVKMPQRGLSEESALIAQWMVKEGDQVQVGDILFVIETDKTTFEVEAEAAGQILEILYDEYDEVLVQKTVCVIGIEGESYEIDDAEEKVVTIEEPVTDSIISEEEPVTEMAINSSGRLKISPRAKNLAVKQHLDYRVASPTGPEGRIIERDIQRMSESGPYVASAAYMQGEATLDGSGLGGRVTTEDISKTKTHDSVVQNVEKSDFEEVRLSGIRKAIARNMQNSLDTTAQCTLHTSFKAKAIMSYRKQIKQNGEMMGLNDISLNDMILYTVSRTLLNHKELNAYFLEDTMKVFNVVHMGVAVDTDRGLMVPTIKYCDSKTLGDIAVELKALAGQCRDGSIEPSLLQGGTFTVSNLGTLSIEHFNPVLNAPQTGILGVGTIVNRAEEVDGRIQIAPYMGLSLTFDHKAIDGAPAGRFLKELVQNLENFNLLLAK